MGKKADALKLELQERDDVVRASMTLIGTIARMCGVQVTDTTITGNNLGYYMVAFSNALQPLVQSAAALAGTLPIGRRDDRAQSTAIVRAQHDDQDDDGHDEDVEQDEHAELRQLASDMIGASGGDAAEVTTAIRAEVEARRSETEAVRDELKAARLLINRIAGAMQIDKWSKEGDELLERAQRWNTFTLMLQRRIKRLAQDGREDLIGRPELANELRVLLAALMCKPEYEAWVRALPTAAFSEAVTNAISTTAQYPTVMRDIDVAIIKEALSMAPVLREGMNRPVGDLDVRSDKLQKMFESMYAFPTVTREFTRLMNIIVLPMLAGFLPKDEPAPADLEHPGTV